MSAESLRPDINRFTKTNKTLKLALYFFDRLCFTVLVTVKHDPSCFDYTNYRSYLVDLLKARRLSYRAFAERYGQIISLNALAKLLSHGRGKTGPRETYRISPEKLVLLLKALKLPKEAITHLLLLKLQNDAEPLEGPNGDLYPETLQKVIDLHKNGVKMAPETPTQNSQISKPSHVLLLEVLSQLPETHRKKLFRETVREARIYASRQKSVARVNLLNSGISTLEELIRSGSV